MSPPPIVDDSCPRLWMSWRDGRDGTVVDVVENWCWDWCWDYLLVDVEGVGVRRIERREFDENFSLIYDPYTGYDRAGDDVR